MHEADLDLAVTHLLEDVVHLVRELQRDLGEVVGLPPRAGEDAPGREAPE